MRTPEQIKAYQKKWSQDNKDRLREKRKKYYEDNKERANRLAAEWRLRNLDKVREYSKESYARSKDKILAAAKRNRLRREYGLTAADYQEMIEKQNGRCAICDQITEKLYVDHCHSTGLIRGLLCLSCNTSLGNMGDSPERLRRAADYIEGNDKTTFPDE